MFSKFIIQRIAQKLKLTEEDMELLERVRKEYAVITQEQDMTVRICDAIRSFKQRKGELPGTLDISLEAGISPSSDGVSIDGEWGVFWRWLNTLVNTGNVLEVQGLYDLPREEE